MTESISIQIKDLIILFMSILGICGFRIKVITKKGKEFIIFYPAIIILIIEIIYIFKVY